MKIYKSLCIFTTILILATTINGKIETNVGFNLTSSFLSHNTRNLLLLGATAGALIYNFSYQKNIIRHEIPKYDKDLLKIDTINNYLQMAYHTCPALENINNEYLKSNDYRDFILAGSQKFLAIKKNAFDQSYQIHNEATRQEKLKDIIDISWFLYSIALANGDAYNQGSMIIHDNGKIFDFLLDYVKAVNPSYNKGPQIITNNPYGYCRASSHLKKLQKAGNVQYGIDIRFNGNALPILPAGKRHILFGKIDNNRTFIKFEDHGMYWADGWLSHIKYALVTTARKCARLNELPGSRKEHIIPKDILLLAKKHNIQEKTIALIYLKACNQKLTALQNVLIDRYGRETIYGRMGNEVILSEKDLDKVEYYKNQT